MQERIKLQKTNASLVNEYSLEITSIATYCVVRIRVALQPETLADLI